MPEGETIYQVAAALRPDVVGKRIDAAEARHERVAAGLAGRTVLGITTRGKHMLVEIDDGSTLHIHLGMKGSWHRRRASEPLGERRGELALQLVFGPMAVVCFFAPVVERLRTAFDPSVLLLVDEAVRRLRRAALLPIGDAILNQTIVCGIGNVYKSEILFLERVHPRAPVGSLDDATVRAFFARGSALLRAHRGPGPRNTTGRRRPALFVYRRGNQPCLRCREPVRQARMGDPARGTWWCPRCQPR